jgi:magnesium transporter
MTSGGLEDLAPDRIGESPADGTFTWVDVRDPDDADIRMLHDHIDLPPLVLEDLDDPLRTVTFRQHDDHAFVVFYALRLRGADLTRHQVLLYVTPDHVITVRQADLPELDDLEDRWRQDIADTGQNRPATLLYSTLDVVVDSYFPVLDAIADQVEDIEDRILEAREGGIQREIIELRRALLTTRRILAAEREALSHMFRKDHPMIDRIYLPYFQDLYDQVNRATETVDSSREMLSSAMGAYESQVSNELNVVVRRLTAWTIILTTLTFIAGVYGMNFEHMPELSWSFGYPYALVLMLVLAGGMWLGFRRSRWL